MLTEESKVSKFIGYFGNDTCSIPNLTSVDDTTLNVVRRKDAIHDGVIIDGIGANLVVVNFTFDDGNQLLFILNVLYLNRRCEEGMLNI